MPKVIGYDPVDLGYGGMINYAGIDNNVVLDEVKDGNYPTPPIPGDTYWSSVTTLLQEGLTDASNKSANASAVGSVTTPTMPSGSAPVAGTTGIYLDTEGEGFTIPASNIVDFGTGDFTIETWIYPTTAETSTVRYVFDFRGTTNHYCYLNSSTKTLNTPEGAFTTSNFGWNAWNHLAFSREGTDMRIFLNGVLVTSHTMSTSFGNGVLTWAKRYSGYSSTLLGYYDDFRITKGVARYTQAFTPTQFELPTE
jgi:hypothetical protein